MFTSATRKNHMYDNMLEITQTHDRPCLLIVVFMQTLHCRLNWHSPRKCSQNTEIETLKNKWGTKNTKRVPVGHTGSFLWKYGRNTGTFLAKIQALYRQNSGFCDLVDFLRFIAHSARVCCITNLCDASCYRTRHPFFVSERVYTPNHGRALQSQADLRLPVDGEPWWRWWWQRWSF